MSVSAAIPTDVPQDAAVGWFQKARTALDQGRPSEAADALRKAVVIDPGRPYLYHFLGEARLGLGEHYEALQEYTRAFHLAESDLPSTMRAADLHAFCGKWEDSEPLARRVTEQSGDNVIPLYVWALSLYKLNRLDEADAVLQRLLRLDPNRLNARYYLGLCHRDRGDLEKARACFSQVTQAIGSREQIGTNQIFGEAFFGETMLARQLGETVVSERARQFADQTLAEGRQAMQRQDYNAAAQSFAQALTLCPDHDEAAVAAEACFDVWKERILSSAGDLAARHNEWVAVLASQGDIAYRRALADAPAYYAVPQSGPESGASSTKRRVFDCFMFSEELDILELRLDELDDCVDYFVLVESPWTHQGTPKHLAYAENKERFQRFNHKIIHVVAEQRIGKLTFHQENYQRDCIIEGLRGCRDDDVVLISDLDEIPRRDIVRGIVGDTRLASQMVALSMVLRPYFINFESYDPWAKAISLPYGLVRRIGVNLSRYMMVRPPTMLVVKVLHDTGWHLTWMGGAEAIIRKYNSYIHTEVSVNAPPADEIRDAVASGAIVRHAYRKGRWIDHTKSCPDTILRDLDRFRKLGWIHEPPAE